MAVFVYMETNVYYNIWFLFLNFSVCLLSALQLERSRLAKLKFSRDHRRTACVISSLARLARNAVDSDGGFA